MIIDSWILLSIRIRCLNINAGDYVLTREFARHIRDGSREAILFDTDTICEKPHVNEPDRFTMSTLSNESRIFKISYKNYEQAHVSKMVNCTEDLSKSKI